MLNKLDKYWLKFFLLCDCLAGYSLTGMPYIGGQGNQRNVGLSSDVVKFLSTLLHFSGINTAWGVNMETHENQCYNLTKNMFNNLLICAIT